MSPTGASVLVVDDDPDALFFFEEAAKQAGLSVRIVTAECGDEALGILDACCGVGESLPVCVVLDLKLPRISGVEVTQRLRQRSEFRHLPVIIFTSSTLHSDRDAAYASGANSYINKPSTLAELTEAVSLICTYWADLNQMS